MTSTTSQPPASGSELDQRFRRLRLFNIVMGAFHAIQGVAVLVLANEFALPVTATYLENAPGIEPATLTNLFEVRVAWGVSAFLFLSALFHWIISSPGFFGRYRRGLLENRNYFRWVEYSLSASVMIVLIAMLTGISDIAALIALFGVNASMILFGWLVEKYEEPGSPDWTSFVFGCIAGIVPWVAIGVYILSPGGSPEASPPGFVYGIFISLFVFFNVFAVNQVLQYARIGRWRDYLTGETAYIILSLTAKSALAWQVFGGTLAT